MMVSNVAYQNEQLTNNAYTLIALKRLDAEGDQDPLQ